MGGKNAKADRPANIITLCSIFNGLIESDAIYAAYARDMGWKLDSWLEPSEQPVFDVTTGLWWLLDNDYRRSPDNTTRSRLGS
jgi:hypothetical protein